MKTHCTTVMTDNLLDTQDAKFCNIHTFYGSRFFSPQCVIASMYSLRVERDDGRSKNSSEIEK